MEKENSEVNQQVYDVVVIGAGISGSNAAYIMSKRCKKLKILVIEAKGIINSYQFLNIFFFVINLTKRKEIYSIIIN